MKKNHLLVLVSLCFTFVGFAQNSKPLSPKKIRYTCNPYCYEETMYFDEPGDCPECGSKRYACYPEIENADKNYLPTYDQKVAVLLFQDVEIIDFAGPWEVLGASGMQVFSVAKNDSMIHTGMGMQIKPDYTFENCPTPDILLIPGGYVDAKDTTVVNWIKRMDKVSDYTFSVCTGAYYLGASGILDNIPSTTYYPAVPDLKKIAPTSQVLDDVRFVHTGRIITSAGLSSGIDAAFHLVAQFIGTPRTLQLANDLEYNWNEKDQYVRGNLADKFVQDFLMMFIPYQYEMLKYEGGRTEWTVELDVDAALTVEEIQQLIDIELTTVSNFKKEKTNCYSIVDHNINYNINLTIERSKTKTHLITLTVKKA